MSVGWCWWVFCGFFFSRCERRRLFLSVVVVEKKRDRNEKKRNKKIQHTQPNKQLTKVVVVLPRRVHRLHAQLPLGKVPRRDGLVQVLRRVRVVGAADGRRLGLEQVLDAFVFGALVSFSCSFSFVVVCRFVWFRRVCAVSVHV